MKGREAQRGYPNPIADFFNERTADGNQDVPLSKYEYDKMCEIAEQCRLSDDPELMEMFGAMFNAVGVLRLTKYVNGR